MISAENVDREHTPGMGSVAEIYKIGRGPSSSHTIGPERACLRFRELCPRAESYKVIFYGSLAKTGRGHGTDKVIEKTLAPVPVDIVFDTETVTEHPNTMDLFAYEKGSVISQVRVKSIGGGYILFGDEKQSVSALVYSETQFTAIADYCRENDLALWEYVKQTEGEKTWNYLSEVWTAMKRAIHRGLRDEGILPGGLEVKKKAKQLYEATHVDETAETRENRLICAYAFAVSEQNASGETIVTAPTCGAAGVLPAVLYYEQKKHSFSDEQVIRALATAALSETSSKPTRPSPAPNAAARPR